MHTYMYINTGVYSVSSHTCLYLVCIRSTRLQSEQCWWNSSYSVSNNQTDYKMKHVSIHFLLVSLVLFFNIQAAPSEDRSNVDETVRESRDDVLYNQFKYLTAEQLAELDEFLSQQLNDESLVGSSSETLHRNTRRPHSKTLVKRDVLWTTTEVLDCVRRLRLYQNGSKLDLTTEMLNCYRRLKQRG